jgi:Tol biopolymer transport system component
MIGEVLSHYRILEKLGAGGMGEVYLAEDTMLGRRVALKLLPSEHTRDPERLGRFKQEAKAASALNHPNILTIHEMGEAGGRHFIATEYIEGQTLGALLRSRGAIPVGEALDVSTQVAAALAAAHGVGIVHRDLKPENVMRRSDGYVKVLDFGLAKLTEPLAPESLETSAPTQSLGPRTGTGVVLGTAHYLSPEQAAGRTVDARSDIFSFGAMLYEMVAGERAFDRSSVMETVAAILDQEPKRLPAKVPPELSRLILRCLRKEPDRRYQSMADLKVALEELREESTGPGRSALAGARRRSGRRAASVLAILAVVLLAVLVWRARVGREPQAPLRATALTTLPGVERSPSFSPDADRVAFAWTGPGQDNADVYVQMIGQGSPLRLTNDPLDDYNPAWSPDGRWIAFLRGQRPAPSGLRNRELRLIPPLGGPERKLADVRGQDFFPAGAYLAWSPDSRSLVVTDSPGEGQPDALYVVSLETGEKKRLTTPLPPVFADTSPAVSPDGTSLVFLRRTSWGSGELQRLPLGDGSSAAGEPTRLTVADQRADFPAWMPDGREIVYSARRSLWRIAVAGGSAPARIPYVGEDGLMPVVSRPRPGRTTRLAFVRSFDDWNFWRIETTAPGTPASSSPVLAISSTRAEYHPEISPDGRLVAFSSNRSGDAEIWVSDPDGSNAVQLTSLGAVDTNCPRWSPDGRSIVFSSTAGGEFDVYVVSAAGGKPRRLTSDPAIDIASSVSRDGRWIYFNSMRSGDYRVWKMPAEGGDAVQVTRDQGTQAFEAPDGSLYYLTASIVSPVWRIPPSGGEPVKVLDGVVWFNFCLVENGAYYIDRFEGETRLRYLEFATGRSTTVARNLGEVGAWMTASRDGRTILFTRVDSSTDDVMLVDDFR